MKTFLAFVLFEIFCVSAHAFFLGDTNTTFPCKQCLSFGEDEATCELEDQLVYQSCRCDSECEVYSDCCPSTLDICFNRGQLSRESDENRSFQCQDTLMVERTSAIPGIGEHYWMISTCQNDWKEKNRNTVDVNVVEEHCSNGAANLPPVTDSDTGLVYKNDYCARCNEATNVVTWDVSFRCDLELNNLLNGVNYTLSADVFERYCNAYSFVEPASLKKPARQCYPHIETCLEFETLLSMENKVWNSSYYNSLNNLCTKERYQYQVVEKMQPHTLPYRNEHCALCNNIDRDFIECFNGPLDNNPSNGFEGLLFIIVLDVFGSGRVTMSSSSTTSIQVYCPVSTEVFDPVAMQCRPVLSTQKCNISSEFTELIVNNCTECAGELIVLMDSTMYTFTDTNTLLYNDEQYVVESNTSNGAPVICVNFSTNGTNITKTINFLTFTYPVEYAILTYIGCSLSVVGCLIILLTYTLFNELRTLPSLILMQLAIAILIGNLLILLSGPVGERVQNTIYCKSTAIFSHFIFLAQFMWMSLMSTEIARNLYRASRMKTKESKSHKVKLLLAYLLTGWCIPLLIVLIAVIVNFTTTDLVLYGELEDGTQGRCWINHAASVFVSFVTPLAISLIYNTTLFVLITIYLCKSARSHSKLNVDKKGNVSFLRLNVAVFSVSGISWFFGFLALLPGLLWAWIPYIILNSTQGFVIFLLFLCTKRVARLYIALVFHRNVKSSSTTLLTLKEQTSRSTKGKSQSELDICHEKEKQNTSLSFTEQ